MHPCGKFLDKSLKDLARVAIWKAINDAGIRPQDIGVAYVGNTLAGLLTGQEGVRGQIIMSDAGFGGIPVINVESACASGAVALHGAWLQVASGMHDVALAVGVEKFYGESTAKSIHALASTADTYLVKLGFHTGLVLTGNGMQQII